MRALIVAILALATLAASAAEVAIPREAQRHQRDLTRAARQVWGLDAPVATFAAQIHQESRWRANALSHVGAQGMAQFMPATAAWIAEVYPELAESSGQPAPTNPAWALRALVTYDRHLWDRITADNACERMAMTLSAYNGGHGWLRRDRRATLAGGADPARWFGHVERFNAGRHADAFAENRSYPRRILGQLEPRYVAAGWGHGLRCEVAA